MRSLTDFAGDLEKERFVCPIRASRFYLYAISDLSPRPSSLFVSPLCPSKSLLENALSYLFCEMISGAGAVRGTEG